MKKVKSVIPMVVGLVIGQIFAEGGDRPFSIINTLRVGYDDNVFMRENNQKESMYIQDEVDLSFNASLAARTDLMFRSKFVLSSDDDKTQLDPNIYAILSHSVSPRLLLQLSDLHKSGQTADNGRDRYDYYINTVAFTPTYVLTSKDRLETPVSYTIKRHDGSEVDGLDYTTIRFGGSWLREIRPQRTSSSLNIFHNMVEYDNADSSYDSTDVSVGLSHTFNQEWHGSLEAGVTYVQPDYADQKIGNVVVAKAKNEESYSPLLKAGLVYTPTPRSRISADLAHKVKESNVYNYGAGRETDLTLRAQYDFTAKIMGKAMARFRQTDYEEEDGAKGGGSSDEERMDLDFRLQYKLNRINFLELGYRHTQKDGDYGDWERNRVDLGWRVEL